MKGGGGVISGKGSTPLTCYYVKWWEIMKTDVGPNCAFIYLFLSIYLFTYLSMYLAFCLSVCLSL